MLDLAVYFLVAFAAATISGAAGFGGALLLLPILVATVGPMYAIPLLTIAQMIGNLSRAGLGYKHIHWKPVVLFLLGVIPLSILGALSFVQLPKDLVTRAIVAAILIFVVLKCLGILKLKGGFTLLVVAKDGRIPVEGSGNSRTSWSCNLSFSQVAACCLHR